MLVKFIVLTAVSTLAVGSRVLLSISRGVHARTDLKSALWWISGVLWFIGVIATTIAVGNIWFGGE